MFEFGDFEQLMNDISQLLKEAEEKGYDARGVREAETKDTMRKFYEEKIDKARQEGYLEAQHDLIPPAIVQARLKVFEEVERFVGGIKTDGGGNGRRLKEQILSFIKENKTKI